MSKSVSLLAVALCVVGLTARAQEKLPTMPEILADTQDQEVYLQGYLGNGPNGPQFALPAAGHVAFPVTFDYSDDDLEARIKGCDFAGKGPCKAAAYGFTYWQGAVLGIMVTSIETLEPPGKMKP